MGETMRRLGEALSLRREAFVWMDLNDRATGDALILVVLTRLLIMLGLGFGLLGLATSASGLDVLFRSLLNAAVFWLVYSGITYAVSRYLLEGDGSFATILRITGFAYPTLLLTLVTIRIFDNGIIAFVVASIWFLLVVAHGVRYESDLPIERAALAAGLGLVGWMVVASILGYGLV
ncbi:MAG: YIP1 family protein [Acidimicrobiia bacterium]